MIGIKMTFFPYLNDYDHRGMRHVRQFEKKMYACGG